ncbi:TauD/TfdA family dioxygenase [Kitasatospora sp. MAP5-34]|uniref:TauD/TfdA family dioxygenase n=1 Tax=Kitasatospora sp. MAP5-34 TaxID=3035102 RepID=UPI002475738E|nr:TauD/TfdA family dioxygenase [Kitasatospora sp. MAP5-34]MDH6576348.1 L-asparagine oxygenase [Kitasatospora sp. MAP5-34]
MTTMTEAPLAPSTGALTLRLTDRERYELGLLADELARVGTGRVDDLKWLDQARELSCRIPLRLLEIIRRYRHDCGPAALLMISNLPVDESGLPDTPTVRESVERRATIPAAVSAMLSLQLGEVIAFKDEKTGALVQNVVPVPGLEQSQSNAGSVDLQMHVENAFHPNRPDFVGLLCLRNDHTRTAGTLVSSIRQALPLVSDEARRVLGQPRFVTQPPPSFQAGDSAPAHAVLDGDPADPNVRVDFAATVAIDEEARQALERLRDAVALAASVLVLQSGDLAFIDNRMALHGRSSFVPRYDGNDRWLHRTFVHLDNRRSRVDRPGDGAVLN